MRSTRHLVILACTALVGTSAGSCTCGGKKKGAGGGDVAPVKAALIAQKDAPDGLNMRLREGALAGRAQSRNKVASTTPLNVVQTNELLARLPAFESKSGDKVAFALRESSKPPPRTGETLTSTFPPAPGAAVPTTEAGELRVLRHSPEGDVPLAPHLSVTFSQPMVAITSHADAAKTVPVVLTPQPKGQWRWVGTRTLLFNPDVRFPQATSYTVEVAAGTRAQSGKTLAAAEAWTFQTPPPTVKSIIPNHGPQKLDPLIVVHFDQKVDAASIAKHVHIRYDSEDHPLRVATADEIAGDAAIKNVVEMATRDEQVGRFVVLKPRARLPTDTGVTVVVAAGTPSAEGPRVTASDQSESFRTYGPLEISESRCDWGASCPPRSGWRIRMTNPLDLDKFDPPQIRVSPDLPGKTVSASGPIIHIRGRMKGRTTYKVTIPGGLTDIFEQTLGSDQTREFNVGPASPMLSGPSGLVVLDPYSRGQTLNVFSTNQKTLDVEIHRVSPGDWDDFSHYMYRWRDKTPPALPGRRVFSGKVEATAGDDQLVETPIDISKALDNGLGHAIVIVEPSVWPDKGYKPRVITWVQATKIGLDAFVDNDKLLAWATELDSGKPAAGVALDIAPMGARAKTAADGTASIELPAASATKGRHRLVARRGSDVAFLPERLSWWSDHGGWYRRPAGSSLRWMVFDDRGMYRPGEEVHAKGWLRKIDNAVGGDISGLEGAVRSVSYVVRGSRGNEITKGEAPVNGMGGFDLKFELPTTPNLGAARIELRSNGGIGSSHYHRFQIEEFRRPEYEVTTEVSPGPFTIGGAASVTAKASYYAGGGLAAAPVNWSVMASPGSFSPPGHDGFTFGSWVPWWQSRHGSSTTSSKALTGTTTSAGQHVLDIDFLSAKPPRPMSVVATARVTDVNRQTWASTATLLVHPSKLYVGIKRDRYFVEKGKPIEFEMVVVDQDGAIKPDITIAASIVRLDWKWKGGRYTEVEKDGRTCNQTSASTPRKCSLPTSIGGTYKITASVVDDEGRPNETSIQTWVTGGSRPPARNVELETVTLIPDKETYKPGDTAQILLSAPFEDAEGVLTIRRSGIVRSERFVFKGTSHVLDVPVRDGDTPNLYVQVDVVGKTPRLGPGGEPSSALPPRPAFGTGSLKLSVPPAHRTLALTVAPAAKKLEPGGETRVDVTVLDALGKPVAGAEVSVIVVDESVLALSGYATPEPIAAFYGHRGPGVRDFHSRGYVKLARPEVDAFADGDVADDEAPEPESAAAPSRMALEEGKMGKRGESRASGQFAMKVASPMGLAGAKDNARKGGVLGVLRKQPDGQASTPIAVRTNFNALASFSPDEKTDGAGRVSVAVKVPDNLTRYRVMVAAVDSSRQFGSGESSITARMPLMVRPSPPRFLNFGDRFEMPIVVQNQTDAPMRVQVAMRSANAMLTDGGGREVQIAANDRVEVRFPAMAMMPGTARFQVGASAGTWADAKSFELPVWTPATTEAFATYGEIDAKGAVAQPVVKPPDVVDDFGGLEITTSSTQLQALTDAVLYLVRYPYECSEQLSSRVLAIAGLRDVLGAFEADGLPTAAALEVSMKKDIERLRNLQSSDGGFGFWTHREHSWPYLSVHVAHALARATMKGYTVPPQMLSRSRAHLANIERYIPSFYSKQARWTIIAYSLYVRKLLGEVDTRKGLALIASAGIDKLPMEAVGWLLYTLARAPGASAAVAKLHRHLDNRATETAGSASFASAMSDGAHLILHSNRRVDAVILEALLESKPRHDLVPKLVRGLLAHRVRGKWRNTQENVFVLVAMDRYFSIYEKVTPNFTARAWLGDQYAGDHRFAGRTTERHRIDIPMKLLPETAKNLTLQRDGRGRLYYRIGMRYAPADLTLPPADHGFVVERAYEAVDKPADVTRRKDGVWIIAAGARVRVRLTMVAESRRHHVALVDPLPAGLEPMNPALKVTGALPEDPNANTSSHWWWQRTWFEHQNMRDERVEAFASTVWPGVHEYTYVTTATTPGTFVAPPTKAEEMYAPETFGRSAGDRVIIK